MSTSQLEYHSNITCAPRPLALRKFNLVHVKRRKIVAKGEQPVDSFRKFRSCEICNLFMQLSWKFVRVLQLGIVTLVTALNKRTHRHMQVHTCISTALSRDHVYVHFSTVLAGLLALLKQPIKMHELDPRVRVRGRRCITHSLTHSLHSLAHGFIHSFSRHVITSGFGVTPRA